MIIIIIILITVIYLLTLPQIIGLGDSGLLGAAAASLGVPHPPGFPAYVLVGHLFTKLPWGSVAWRLGLISALSSVAVIGVLFRYIQKRNGTMPALAASLFLAFSYSFWSQAVNVETYAVTNLVIVLLSILSLRKNPPWWLIGVIGGIGVGLSPIVVAVVLPIVYLSFARPGLAKLVLSACVAGVVAAATYSYLPIRASGHPFLNWSDPSTLDRLINHVTGGGLSVVSTTAVNGFTGSLVWYADAWGRWLYLLMVNFLGLGVGLAGYGAYEMYKRDKRSFWFWILLVFTNVSLAGLYTSGNRDSWYITSFITGSVFLGEGMGLIYNRYNRYKNYNHYILTAAALVPLLVWFPVMRERAVNTFTTQYIQDLYRDLPEGAVLLGGGETFNAITVYAHEVVKLRPDVLPVDMTIYYGQKWYRDTIRYVTLDPRVRGDDKKNSGDDKKDSGMTNIPMPTFSDAMEFSRILEQFADANADRPIFVTGYLLRQPVYGSTLTPAYVPEKYALEQHGIVYRLHSDVIPAKAGIQRKKDWIPDQVGDDRKKNIPWFLESNYQKALDLIRMEYALAYETEGMEFLRRGEQDQAFDRFTRAGELAPAYFDQNRLGAIMRSVPTATATSDTRDK